MKATYFLGNKSFETKNIPVPEIGDKDVLVKVAAAGICGTDVHIYHGDKGSAEVNPPVVLGHEFSGTIEKVGKAVETVKVGDHVTVDPNAYCGKCHYCKIGKKQLCTNLYAIGVNRDGGFEEYVSVPEEQCYQLNKDLPLKYGAMVEPLACCLHGMDNADIKLGDTVCVVGGGAIGLIMLQLAKIKGASKVIVSEPVEMRRKIALELGATAVIDPINESIVDRITEITGMPGVDVVIECVGNTIAVSQAFEITKRGTTVLLFSVPKPDTFHSLSLMDMYQKELKIVGSMINPDTHERAAALINNGAIKLDKIITHSFPVEKLEDAILMQMSDESLKVIIE